MNQTVWKIVLPVADRQEIECPTGAEFLCAREQFEQVCIWFRCAGGTSSFERRQIAIAGTGHPIESQWLYIGTAALQGGALMFHVFEIPQG